MTPNLHIAIGPGVKRSNGQFTVDCPLIEDQSVMSHVDDFTGVCYFYRSFNKKLR
jgi:hypothetical protein